MSATEIPIFVLPKKRVNGKKAALYVNNVDHILNIQGKENEVSHKYLNGSSEKVTHDTISDLKLKTKVNLPIINEMFNPDETLEQVSTHEGHLSYDSAFLKKHKNGYHSLSFNIHDGKEIIDLSPIYENSSDACSSHDELSSSFNECQHSGTIRITDVCDVETIKPKIPVGESEVNVEMNVFSCQNTNNVIQQNKKMVCIGEDVGSAVSSEADFSTCQIESQDSAQSGSSFENTCESYLTLTGTIKRGKKNNQNVDVRVNISREELEMLEASIVAEEGNKMNITHLSMQHGPHIFIWSILVMPIILVVSTLHSFFIGTITWYNVFIYTADHEHCYIRIFVSPIIILLYPLLIVTFSLGVGFFACFAQLSFSSVSWFKECCDLEKGFYGWLCAFLHLPDCCPYEVIILTDIKIT